MHGYGDPCHGSGSVMSRIKPTYKTARPDRPSDEFPSSKVRARVPGAQDRPGADDSNMPARLSTADYEETPSVYENEAGSNAHTALTTLRMKLQPVLL